MTATDELDEPRRLLDSGYPHTLRPELHRSLDAAGIDYWLAQGLTFWNCPDGRECVAYGYQSDGKPVLAVKIVGITDPEQVIASTLGSGTCYPVPIYSFDGEFTEYDCDACSECGTEWDGDTPNFCPNCGRRIV